LKLTRANLAALQLVLEGIDRGLDEPRMPNRMGRFFRQYRTGREQLNQIFADRQLERRAEGAVSGRHLGSVEIHPLTVPLVSVREFPLGEVANSLAVSEELGGILHVTTWLKGPIANATYNLLKARTGVRSEGDFRWTAPSRWTPGEGGVASAAYSLPWQDTRCLKAVSDDIDRPPHALEYIFDFRIGAPGLKFFRSVCIVKRASIVHVLPGLGELRRLSLVGSASSQVARLREGHFAICLIYREPWSDGWTIVRAIMANPNDVLNHAISWADFRRELDGGKVDGPTVLGIREALHLCGVHPIHPAEPSIDHRLLPIARDVLRHVRGNA
jgi:hypothetical protein